jgi:hypothetical protein
VHAIRARSTDALGSARPPIRKSYVESAGLARGTLRFLVVVANAVVTVPVIAAVAGRAGVVGVWMMGLDVTAANRAGECDEC